MVLQLSKRLVGFEILVCYLCKIAQSVFTSTHQPNWYAEYFASKPVIKIVLWNPNNEEVLHHHCSKRLVIYFQVSN